MSERLKAHYQLNTELSLLSDQRLKDVLNRSTLKGGWGQNGAVTIGDSTVFVKVIPVTDLELKNAYSTGNLYRIPEWYNYGVGSAGFGAFRELATHKKTTNWVCSGEFKAFPLLHHHRILRADHPAPGIPDLKRYVAYWNGSKSIERYMNDRASAKHQLVLSNA